jgi:hypothetical protein
VDNNKMDFREIGWDGMDWVDMAKERDQWWALVNTVMNLRVRVLSKESRRLILPRTFR